MAEITYIELAARDLAASKAFYSAAFGFAWIDYGPTYAGRDGGTIEIGLNGLAQPAPEHAAGEQNGIGPLVLLSTDDLDSARATVESAGGAIVSSPYEYPGGRRFHFRDPGGNILGVYQSE